MHYWGDENVDWAGIDAAAEFIGEGLRRWRIDVRQYKEKYGCVRVYCSLGVTMFHQLWKPGHVFNRYPHDWMWVLDIKLSFIWRWANKVIVPFHTWVYKRYYRAAMKKWPHLKKEIWTDADFRELLDEEP